MRSDHLKNHMKKHDIVDLTLKDSKHLCKDIKSSKEKTSMYREKRKDPHFDESNESPLLSDEIDDNELKKILILDNYKNTKKRKLGEAIFEIITNDDEINQDLEHEYEQKLELGKAINEIIKNHEVYLNSLRPEHKVALDLYTFTTS